MPKLERKSLSRVLRWLMPALLFVAAIAVSSAQAATVTVSSKTFPGAYPYGGSIGYVRIYSNATFVTSSPVTTIQQGTTSSFYQTVRCSVVGTNLVCPQFTINSTTDSNITDARYTADLYDWQNRFKQRWIEGFSVPPSPSTTTWDALELLASGTTNFIPTFYYNTTQTDSRLAAKQDLLVCGTTIKTINSTCVLGPGNVVISGSAAWGFITGTLSSQTDLQTALSGKLSTSSNLSDLANAATARSNLGIGNVENTALSTWAGSANLTTLGTIGTGTWHGSIIGPTFLGTGSSISTKFLRGDGTWQAVGGGGDLLSTNNLSDLANTATARTNLGLGTIATQSASAVAIGGGIVDNVSGDTNIFTNTAVTFLNTGLKLIDVGGSHNLTLKNNETLTANRTFNLITGDADRTLTLSGNATISGSNTGDQDLSGLMVKSNNLSDLTNTTAARTNLGLGSLATQNGTFSGTSSGTNTGDQTITLTGDVTGSGTGSFATTIGASRVTNSMLAGSIDLTSKVTGILPAANGGNGNGFFAVSGPASSTKTFTFPNASATVLTDNALVTAAQGGTANGFFQVSGPTTSTRTFTFPNASATVLTDNALVTAAQGGTGNGFFQVSGPTTSTKTFTFPNASDTVAALGQAQIFTAANTFNNSSGLKIKDTDASNTTGLVFGSNLTADRTLTITTGDASRTLTMSGDATISGTNTGDQTLGSLGAAASGANTDITSVLLNQTGLVVKGATSNGLTIKPNETLTAGRTLNIVTGDATRTLTLSGDTTLSGTNTGDQTITLTGDVTGSGTGSFATTIGATRVTNGMLAGSIAASKLVGTDIATVGTLTAGATGSGFTVALGTSTISGILGATNGGTGNGFTAFSGPASSTKTFTLPNASDTIATLGQTQTFTGPQSFDKLYVSEASPAQITADQNDYNPSGLTNWRLNSDATRNITGIGGPSTGRIVKISNSGSFNIVFNNQNTGSAATNRIATATGSDITLLPNQSVSFFYDNTTQRWRDISAQSGILPAVNFPALTGDVTTTAGSLATTIGTNKVTTTTINANAVTLAKMDASTATANKMLLSGASASPSWSTSTIPTSAGATANKVLLSDGTNYVLSTPTFPNASATSGKTIRSDGTNWIASTATLSDSPSTALKWLRSDGTNWITSTSTLSDTPSTAGKILVSDGTNWVTSTPTFPNASATSGKYIKSDGTNWIASTGSASGTGSCTNQVVTAANSDAAPTCASVTNAMLGAASYSQGTFVATCSGTATASSTLFLFPIGQISALTCTITTATSGIPMPAAGTIKNLRFVAGTGGKAGDAVTILKNASATGMPTCTYGTGTTCSDTSTAGSVVAGDLITVKIVTTTSDTTANVQVSFQLWN